VEGSGFGGGLSLVVAAQSCRIAWVLTDGAMLRAALIFILLLLPSVAHAEKRVVLVVGNSAYQHGGTLANQS
jgi:hypothetical protein